VIRTKCQVHLPASTVCPSKETSFILGFFPHIYVAAFKIFPLACEEATFDKRQDIPPDGLKDRVGVLSIPDVYIVQRLAWFHHNKKVCALRRDGWVTVPAPAQDAGYE
jgi:hypothetical protein